MSFSLSTFTVEINGTPTVAFQAKWQTEADEICRDWANLHRDEIAEEQVGGIPIQPVIKVRLASTPEKAAYYEPAASVIEFFGNVKIVKLIDVVAHPDQTGDNAQAEADEAAKREDAHDDDGRNSNS
jgi:hypothetical protein